MRLVATRWQDSHVKQQLNNLSSKLNVTVQPVFVSPKLEQQLKHGAIL